ncbi:AMP-binding protein [bacterium]|nr:AMP-binding protein [bacterium]
MGQGFENRAEVEAHQLARLRGLMSSVISTNPFYQKKFDAISGLTKLYGLQDFRSRVPFTTKGELSADHMANPPYGSNLTFPLSQYTRCHQTSGSSGQPMRWLDTNESWSTLLDNWTEIYSAARVTASDHMFFAFSFGPFLGFWSAFEAALRVGCLCVPGGGMSSATRLRALLANQTTVLCCTPTYALRLAEVARAEGISLGDSKVRLIIVAGEPGGSIPATREAISSAWHGARVFDHHGMTEVGPVSHELLDRPGILRVLETAYLPEIVDHESGEPVPAGQTGELVLTTLNRVASPLIRYRTGDLVKALPSDKNPPGVVELCLDGAILGRADDMVLVRGVNVYPGAVEQIIQECGGVIEYQVRAWEQRALTEIEITIEAAGDTEGVRNRLEQLLQQRLTLRVPVKVAADGSLPRFEMKARRWIKEPPKA